MQNVIECIFGVLKWCFQILLIAPEYDLEVQARIPAALCAIHNFIQEHDLDEGGMEEEKDVFGPCLCGRHPNMGPQIRGQPQS